MNTFDVSRRLRGVALLLPLGAGLASAHAADPADRSLRNERYSDRTLVTRAQPSQPPQSHNFALATGLQVTATPGDSQVKLSWTPVPEASSYRVYRSASATGGFQELVSAKLPANAQANPQTVTDTGLTNYTSYYYKVTAVMKGEASGTPKIESPVVSATPPGRSSQFILLIPSLSRSDSSTKFSGGLKYYYNSPTGPGSLIFQSSVISVKPKSKNRTEDYYNELDAQLTGNHTWAPVSIGLGYEEERNVLNSTSLLLLASRVQGNWEIDPTLAYVKAANDPSGSASGLQGDVDLSYTTPVQKHTLTVDFDVTPKNVIDQEESWLAGIKGDIANNTFLKITTGKHDVLKGSLIFKFSF